MFTYAQTSLTGTVVDSKTKQPIAGVNVLIQGATAGASTDFDGKFVLKNLRSGDKINFTFVGYKKSTVTFTDQKNLVVSLTEDSNELKEVVVQVGYGSVKKKDATGSVSVITAKDFNRGTVIGVDQMVQGKVAGLQVTTQGGSPGEGGIVRIRGGSSLNANNDPLYVIDGVPVDKEGIKGGKNPLSTINQNNIESVTVLKDASATAIYGSRASNGVIIITTKKGKAGEMQVSFNSSFSVSTIAKQTDVLSASQFRDYVINNGNSEQIAILGNSNTNWQKEVFRTAAGTDNNIALSGGKEYLTYRASLGITNLDGLLKKDNFFRTTFGVNLIGKFFDNHLRMELNNNTSSNKNNYSTKDAIGASIAYDPTQPIFNNDGTYYQWSSTLAGKNPVALLNQKSNFGSAYNSVGNLQTEYKLHFFPDLKLVANLGYEYREGRSYGETAFDYGFAAEKGNSYISTESKKNRLMDLFFNYKKNLNFIKGSLDLTSGYSYQNFRREYLDENTLGSSGVSTVGVSTPEIVNLQSYFGRLVLNVFDKYLVTATLRRDGTSRFAQEFRWGNFPSLALAWKLSDENLFKNIKSISNLKLRFGWGITGQQDVTTYPSIPLYLLSASTAQYQLGNTFYYTLRPQPYNPSLKWEETKTVNAGIDFGFFNNRFTGSVDVYEKNTTDLLAYIPNPPFFGFSNFGDYNVGALKNQGLEVTSEVKLFKGTDFNWTIGGNITFQKSNIESLIPGAPAIGLATGDNINGGIDNKVQINQVGSTPNSYYVLQQIYNSEGKPIDGAFVDRNNDGVISDLDLYLYKKPAPDTFFGLYTNLNYKKFDFSMSWRGSVGNYVYNNVDSNLGYQNQLLIRNTDLSNGVSEVLYSNLKYNGRERYLSDYYIQDASFVKLDNMTIGYNFEKILGKNSFTRLSLTGQNLLIITKYKGIDPEVEKGQDKTIYPRPLIITLGLNINF